MSISMRLRNYLDSNGVTYELVEHGYSHSSLEAARKAHIPDEQMAKAVVLEDHRGYLIAVLPASNKLSLNTVRERCGEALNLSSESTLKQLFDDCESGAIPPIGEAYGMDVVWDDSLAECGDVFFEAGDHTDLVHISGAEFQRLMGGAEHGRFSHHR